ADAWMEPLEEAPPRGIHRHYSRLAVVKLPDTVSDDCRVLWPPPFERPVAGGGERGLHIRGVGLRAGGSPPLRNDSQVVVRIFAEGIRIVCDDTVDPMSVRG